MINLKKNFDQNKKKAFSLIELSIVILIIGIIVAGVTQSSRLIRQFKLSTARNLTQSSAASSVADLSLWLETTSPASFSDSETEDASIAGNTAYITNWNDINPTSSIKRNATGANDNTRPQRYENCINGLPCLRFDGSNDTLGIDLSFLAGTDYTIFVVEQRRAATANYFIGKSVAQTSNTSLELGYSGTSTLRWTHGDATNAYTVGAGASYTTGKIDAYTTASPRLSAFVNSTIAAGAGAASFNHYMNGSSTASTKANIGTPALGTLTSYTNGSIGSSFSTYFTGDIGEIIIYTRALKNEERTAIEDYLSKKWGIVGL